MAHDDKQPVRHPTGLCLKAIHRTIRSLPLLVLLLFLPAGEVYPQTADEEIANLRTHLGLPDSARIELADTPNIPRTENLRLSIATGLDMVTRSNLRGWIDRWTKKKGKRYGRIEIVDGIQDADIILARYVARGQPAAELDAKLWGPYPKAKTSRGNGGCGDGRVK